MSESDFRELVWAEGRTLYRDMPWRDTPSFYNVLVSEIMLQQTQVSRVLVKFAEFMERFPTIESLAKAPLADILGVWSGLGYNRRARFLHEAAKVVAKDGEPTDLSGLVHLPGVGTNTAGAIMNYVYEAPTVFVETNIRTVYLYHFFPNEVDVSDSVLKDLVARTIDTEHPRQWFWALMDYGSYLKAQGNGRLSQSKHYKKQAPLAGSVRQMRGRIIRQLTARSLSQSSLYEAVQGDGRFTPALDGLIRDGLVEKAGKQYRLVGFIPS